MMSDRWDALANRIADGVNVRPGAKLAVVATDPGVAPAAEALVRVAHQRGATPQVLWTDERFDRAALDYATDGALATANPVELLAIDWADCYVALRAMVPPSTGSDRPDTERAAALRVAKGIVSSARWEHTRWAIVRVPTDDWAHFAGLDPTALREQFFAGCLRDWSTDRIGWNRIAARLDTGRTVTIRSEDTDLTLKVGGRQWVVFAGEANFPDGELATAPLDDGVDGRITFPGRFVFADTVLENLRLRFEAGRVVEVSADQGHQLAEALIATDLGSGRVGELGIGLNDQIESLTGDLFFDEKILGTVHLALGRAYPECGGVNRSSLHWDIVKDLRHDAGELWIDDVPLINRGRPTSNLTDSPEEHHA